jgi:hypothetical protein
MPEWLTWIGHASAGFAAAFLAGAPGYTLAVGFYGGKEYKESDNLRNISRDNVLDFISPIVGGAGGLLVRGLVS